MRGDTLRNAFFARHTARAGAVELWVSVRVGERLRGVSVRMSVCSAQRQATGPHAHACEFARGHERGGGRPPLCAHRHKPVTCVLCAHTERQERTPRQSV